MIGRASGHLVAPLVPRLYKVGVGSRKHPFLGLFNKLVGRDNIVDQARRFGCLGVGQLAFQQVGGGGHCAQHAGQARGATGAREYADLDLGQADLGLGIVGDDDPVACQRQFETDAEPGARQGGADRLAALQRLRVHARALDLAQQAVDLHQPVEKTLCGVVTGALLHLGDHVQVHSAGEAVGLARCDHDPLDGVIGQRAVDQRFEIGKALLAHDVHRFALGVPGDGCHALCVEVIAEIGHGRLRSVLRGQGAAVLAGECGFAGFEANHHVDVGIGRDLGRGLGANDEEGGGPVAVVDEVVTIGFARREGGAVAGAHGAFARVLNKGQFALCHDDEFIFVLVPVAQRRQRAGFQCHQIDAELGQAAEIAEAQ